ncbi:TonB-dependent receptor plug domain-containing protein [Endozoicomonas arenosclerae]|uniref:TonB-dependent receptor plug domain-containing protein n=1 Tax=Endozoicomonas arenosclerae TaxID=1633495 RepID=UPI0007820412|nr:TonB-dependent receptor [Endozoicomonas arenosclerae]
MFRRTALSTAIVVAMGASAGSTLAIAEEKEVEKLEKIQVTGSRISRVDVEGSTPVTVITRQDIERSGELTIADVLRSNNLNSFGSFRESSGNSFQSQSNVSLRGIGADRTLILLNGKRVPGSPTMGGSAVNLNTLPASIVERVEILTDGGSAVYGSDAIAGVINIILKTDYEGVEITAGAGRPSEKGGDEDSFSILGGTVGEKGSITFNFEHDEKAIIFDRDRDYIGGKGASIYGRNVGYVVPATNDDGSNKLDDDGKQVYTIDRRALVGSKDADGNCKGDGFFNSGDLCRYDYTSDKAATASRKRDQFFVNSVYHVNDNIDFTNRFMVSRVQSFGQFAPAAAFFTVDPNTTAGDQFFTEQGINKIDADNDGKFESASVYYRFNGIGTRDNLVTDVQGDWLSTLSGSFDNAALGDVNWELNFQYNKTDSKENGEGYVFEPAVQDALEKGQFVNGEFTDEAYKNMTYDTSRKIKMDYKHLDAGFGFDLGELNGGAISWYAGAEFNSWDYSDKYDAQSEAGNVLGSSGNSSGGDRKSKAAFVETFLPVTDQLELQAALRYDDYSDFGSKVSPKVSARFQPMDELMFRASAGQGFRAPSLSDLYAADSFSADDAKDYVKCDKDGVANCEEEQYNVTRKSNADLKAETSTNYNLGVVFSPIDTVTTSLDYYWIKVEDVILLNSLQSVINQERSTGSSDLIERDLAGNITGASVKMVNSGTLETSGLDLKVNWSDDFNFGTLRADFAGTYILEYKEAEFVEGPVNDKIGREGLPEMRFTAGLGYSVQSHDFYLSAEYIDSTAQDLTDDFKAIGKIPSVTTYNFAYGVELPWDGRLTMGVRNLTNEEPPYVSSTGDFDDELYDIQGRTYYAKYTQRF